MRCGLCRSSAAFCDRCMTVGAHGDQPSPFARTDALEGVIFHTRWMTKITVAGFNDAEEVGRFQTLCWEQAYRGVVPDAYLDDTTSEVRVARWRARIGSGERRVIMARSGHDLVGVASTAHTIPDRPDLPALELCTHYVDAHARNRDGT